MESLIKDAMSRPSSAVYTARAEPVQAPAAQDSSFTDVKEAKIVVLGAGGMGNNAVNRLHVMGIKGAETIVMNTDSQHIQTIRADKKILIGQRLTRGLGAGGYPEIGKQAAEESANEIRQALDGADLVFLVTGLGGGTGTGAAPVAAKIAKKLGCIVIGVATMPFKIEGGRLFKAEDGLAALREACDTVIVIENDKLLEVAGNMPLQQAFAVADEIIATMIKGITETISTPSLVNLDYADIKAIMSEGGVAVIGVGESSSASKAREAVEQAMTNPLLDVDYNGASGALIHVSGGTDMTLDDVGEIGDFVSKHLDAGAQTIWGARISEGMQGKIRVITIITGVKSQYVLGQEKRKAETSNKAESMENELGIKMVYC